MGFAVVAVAAAALMLSTNSIPLPMNLFNQSPSVEVEREFINFIAKFGKAYSSKDEIA